MSANFAIRQMLCPKSKWGIKCPYQMIPRYITIHNTANKASAYNEVSYMNRNSNTVSYHYAVDDKEAIQALPLDRNGWHCGDGNGYGNRASIGIEICYSTDYDSDKYSKAEENAVWLTAMLLKQFGLNLSAIKKHQDWSGKYCPHRILDNGAWQSFLGRVEDAYKQITAGTVTRQVSTSSHHGIKPESSSYDLESYANGVLQGKYGNGDTRRNKLGKYYNAVQAIVNHKVGKDYYETLQTLKQEVYKGVLGNGDTRKKLLGNYYTPVQDLINSGK